MVTASSRPIERMRGDSGQRFKSVGMPHFGRRRPIAVSDRLRLIAESDRFANELGDEGGITQEGRSPDHYDVHGQIYVDLGQDRPDRAPAAQHPKDVREIVMIVVAKRPADFLRTHRRPGVRRQRVTPGYPTPLGLPCPPSRRHLGRDRRSGPARRWAVAEPHDCLAVWRQIENRGTEITGRSDKSNDDKTARRE
jgi:hypothetical protein